MKPWLWIVAAGVFTVRLRERAFHAGLGERQERQVSPTTSIWSGAGQADVQEDARNRARADLAKILEVGVSAKSSDVTTFTSEGGGKTESQVSRSIVTRTDQIVRGIQIPETWQDPQTKSTYALAVLPRSQAAMGLRADIDRLDAATQGYVQGARSAPDLLAQVASASRALDSQRERDAVQRTLQVIDVTGQAFSPSRTAASSPRISTRC